MLKKIASTYLQSIQEMFQKHTGTDFGVKVVFEQDVADYIIDFWNVPSAKSTPPAPEDTPPASADPLDTLAESFPEIIEYTDESEFIDYCAEDDHFEQAAMDDAPEEFLEAHETQTEE